jgi:hypothetical protein
MFAHWRRNSRLHIYGLHGLVYLTPILGGLLATVCSVSAALSLSVRP